ncbi:unnamed protein product, partial [marine sediment metagenome]
AAVFAVFRVSSLSSLISGAALPILLYTFGYAAPVQVLGVFTLLVIVARHHENIKRFLKGEEKTFG